MILFLILPCIFTDYTEASSKSNGSDFYETDSDRDEDFVPGEGHKKKPIPSSSYSLSNSSADTTSSSSDSESTKSNTQLHDAQELPLILQQIASRDIKTEVISQLECEFRSTPVATKVKKKAKKSAAWKQNKRKALKHTGQEYTNSSGKVIQAKKMGPPCTEKCLFSCSKRISIEDRQKLFAGYWELGCPNRQRDYIASCITTLANNYRRLKTNPKYARKPNSCFYLPINGNTVRVCKTFFLSTLAIAPKFLRCIIAKRTATPSFHPIE